MLPTESNNKNLTSNGKAADTTLRIYFIADEIVPSEMKRNEAKVFVLAED